MVNLGEDAGSTLTSKWNLADLLKNKLGDVAGGVELLREIVSAPDRNPDVTSSNPDVADARRRRSRGGRHCWPR